MDSTCRISLPACTRADCNSRMAQSQCGRSSWFDSGISDVSRRIHIFGASGSGTSTLGRMLSERLAIPWFDVDDYYWQSDPPYTAKRTIDERLALLRADLDQSESWTLSGSLDGWGDPLRARFALVVFLEVPTSERIRRLRARESARFGASAVAPGGWFHKNHEDFVAWASRYEHNDLEGRSRRRHEAWIPTLTCPVLRLDGQQPLSELVERVVAATHAAH